MSNNDPEMSAAKAGAAIFTGPEGEAATKAVMAVAMTMIPDSVPHRERVRFISAVLCRAAGRLVAASIHETTPDSLPRIIEVGGETVKLLKDAAREHGGSHLAPLAAMADHVDTGMVEGAADALAIIRTLTSEAPVGRPN